MNLDDQLAQLSLGLLAAGGQNKSVGEGLLLGYNNYGRVQDAKSRRELLKVRLEEIEEKKKEREEKKLRQQGIRDLIGQPAQYANTMGPPAPDGSMGVDETAPGRGLLSDGQITPQENAQLGQQILAANPTPQAYAQYMNANKPPPVGKLYQYQGAGGPTYGTASQALGKAPYRTPSLTNRAFSQGGGMIQNQESSDRGKTWRNVGEAYPRHKARDPSSKIRAQYNTEYKNAIGGLKKEAPPFPVYQKFRSDSGMDQSWSLGEKTPQGYEVFDTTGKLVGHYQ